MSGHNKWSKIKRKKGAEDSRRGKIFTKLIREITTAAKIGGGDASANPRLRSAVMDARNENMPNSTIEKAIKKGTGELEGESYEEFRYEGYGPNGVAVIVDVLTDNRNRTVSEIRNIFSKHHGNMGETGCVSWGFKYVGLLSVDNAINEDKLMEVSLEAGADDIVAVDEGFEVTCDPTSFEIVKNTLQKKDVKIQQAGLTMKPQNTVKLTGNDARVMLNLVEALEDNDDVQKVYTNGDVDTAELEKLVEN